MWVQRPDQTAQDVPLCINEGMDVVVGGVHRPPLPIGYDRLSRGEVAVGSTDVKKKNPPRRTWYKFYVDRIAFWRARKKTWHRGINATKKEPSFAHLLRDFIAIVAPSFSGGGHGGKYCFEGCDAG